eukprot:CAMPEP_0172675730 /NCGR_PEP_ID=MMETSP1074-20121228/13457_1 /TAXON_ID=2916 /ORGANISM="Ceratium fusus, Strain PA161109" /LENGTH=207 /DNA_ID=CAMNT_0013493225 /DNA_START=294 /DNA_END=918 /DNA_ORIENTATION=-
MTVRHGDAVWNIRRRHKQVWEMHSSLLRGLGRSASLTDLPRPPPKATARSLLFGQRDDQFLQERGAQIEQYVNNLLCYIPMVEQCEALYKFLCFTNLRNWEYGEMVSGGAPPVDASAVAKLPRMKELTMDTLCVVCQNKMELGNEAEDVRVLPCGHKFHYAASRGGSKSATPAAFVKALPSLLHRGLAGEAAATSGHMLLMQQGTWN